MKMTNKQNIQYDFIHIKFQKLQTIIRESRFPENGDEKEKLTKGISGNSLVQ